MRGKNGPKKERLWGGLGYTPPPPPGGGGGGGGGGELEQSALARVLIASDTVPRMRQKVDVLQAPTVSLRRPAPLCQPLTSPASQEALGRIIGADWLIPGLNGGPVAFETGICVTSPYC